MGWFDEQIRQRKLSDQEVFEESILRMASAIVGGRGAGRLSDARIVTKDAIDDILKYYHFRAVELPDGITDPEEQLDHAMRPHGLMRRNVELTEGWYRDACGPMMLFRQEDGLPVAVLPKSFRGYWFRGEDGRPVDVDRSNAAQFGRDAICFYRPLPLKKLGISDLLVYMKDCLSSGDVAMLLLLTFLVTLTGMLTTRIIGLLMGFVVEQGNLTLLASTAVFLLSAAVSNQLLTASRELAMNRIEIRTSLAVQAAMMMRLISLPAPFFRKYSAGELSNRCQSVGELAELLIGSMVSMGLTSVVSLLHIVQIFRIAPGLAAPALLTILGTVVVTLSSTLLQMRVTREQMDREAKESGLSYALITGIQKIRLAGAEKRAFARWARCYAEGAELAYAPPLFLQIHPAITMAVSLAGTTALYFAAFSTGVTPAAYMAFNNAYGMVAGAFASLAGIAVSLARIRPILEMAEPILKTVPEVSEGREMITRISGGIELNQVYFRYREDQPYVVNGINLKIRPGEYVAVVGRTGCGKSTLMRLLLGFEKPERGAIYYDGKDMERIDLRSLRRKIGAVTQDGSLFQGDIYSNIVISAPQLSQEDAWEAAELAGIADDIRDMPMGMNTVIGEGQGGISGGQKQRLMIARAVAPKPKILMFDEATSALDNRTQRQVSEALDGLKCTRIVIAHRLSTIRHCDRILLLEQGRIAEDGTYEELMAQGGMFAELVKRQQLHAIDD